MVTARTAQWFNKKVPNIVSGANIFEANEYYNFYNHVFRYNNEHYVINCELDLEKCRPQQVVYKLENLSSFTTYKIYITAYTTAPSEHSNDIIIKTLVGSKF